MRRTGRRAPWRSRARTAAAPPSSRRSDTMRHLTVCAAVSLTAMAAPAFAQNIPGQTPEHDQAAGVHDPDTAMTPDTKSTENGRISDCYSQTKLSRACERMAQADTRAHEQSRDWHQTDEF